LVDNEKEITHHEQLHQRPVTCVSMCKNGEILATGSEDLSVRVWKIVKTNNNGRRLLEICVFSGHEDTVTCLDVSSDFNIVVSGGRDCRVCIWDYRNQVMIRTLSRHTSKILSVSINSISGNIVTLTNDELRIYHLNGELVGQCNFADENIPSGTVAVAPPCGEWQYSVMAVTGHQHGNVYLWKFELQSSLTSGSSYTSRVGGSRKLSAVCLLDKVHSADISALRLCPANGTATQKNRGPIRKAYEESRHLDLLVGDAEGYLSRWSVARLEQLSQKELMSLAV
jgi:WD40 repeat protein